MFKSTAMFSRRRETARAATESFTCRLFIRGLDATRFHNPQKGHPGRHNLPGPRRLGAGLLQLAVGLGNTDDSGAILDRKSTRLNSSHGYISYAVFCLKKKKTTKKH